MGPGVGLVDGVLDVLLDLVELFFESNFLAEAVDVTFPVYVTDVRVAPGPEGFRVCFGDAGRVIRIVRVHDRD